MSFDSIASINRPCPKFIYVEQYGYFWKLKYREWIDICLASQRPDWDGYNLPDNRELKVRPRLIHRLDEGENVSYDIDWPHILVRPLDWDREAFKDWLKFNDPKQLKQTNST